LKVHLDKPFLTRTIILIFFIAIAWTLKTVYFVHELELSPHKKFILISSTGFSLVLVSLLASKKSKLHITAAFSLYLVVNLLFYADVVYERYYDSILHIELAGQANQIGDVFSSVITLMYTTDFLYWLDLPFILAGFIWYNRKQAEHNKPLVSAIFMSSGIAALLITAFFPLKTTFSDQYMVSLTGIIPAHIFTVHNSLYEATLAGEVVSENSAKVLEIKSEFKKNQALQKTSPYFGKFEGKNVIMVQAESLNTFPVGLEIDGIEITPNMNELISISQYYPNTYLQIGRGNTSDAEFVANNSIYPMAPKGIYQGYPQNNFLSLGKTLKDIGYVTTAAHGNSPDFWNRQEAYKKQGYQTFYHKDHPTIKKDEIIGMGISDESIFKQMVDLHKTIDGPFYNFIVTLTNHRPFVLPEEYQYLDLPEKFNETATGNYLQSVYYFDQALGKFIEDLKKEGIWEDTIFVMYGDHYGPIPKDEKEIKKLLNVTFNEKERFRVPLIIHHPGQTKGMVNEIVTSQMDIYPTLTSLLGIERPLVQFGKALDVKHEGFAGFAYETTRYSFYTDDYNYVASHDGTFESGKCIDNNTNEETDIEACRPGFNKLFKDIEASSFMLENNLIPSMTK
jgi:lipoteichoic acid synthase